MGAPGAGQAVSRVLVKAPNWVGDCVMATPALAYLRAALPQARLDVLARPSVARVLHGHPDIDTLHGIHEHKMTRAEFDLLRQAKYDAAVLLPNSFGSAWLAFRLGISRRIGFSRGARRLLLTHPISYSPRAWQTPTPKPLTRKSLRALDNPKAPAPGHMVYYYLQAAQSAVQALTGNAPPLPERDDIRLKLAVSPEATRQLDALLKEKGLDQARLIGINPGAAYGGAKRWGPEQLAAVADALAASLPAAAIISTASRFETELTDQVQRYAKTPIHRLGESLDLQGLVALMDRLALLVTNDSGAMHLGAARSTPTVALFGPTDWNVTAPWNPRARVVRCSPPCAPCFLRECPTSHQCMKAITSEAVASAAHSLLSKEEFKP